MHLEYAPAGAYNAIIQRRALFCKGKFAAWEKWRKKMPHGGILLYISTPLPHRAATKNAPALKSAGAFFTFRSIRTSLEVLLEGLQRLRR